jgi:hypothetical protein
VRDANWQKSAITWILADTEILPGMLRGTHKARGAEVAWKSEVLEPKETVKKFISRPN